MDVVTFVLNADPDGMPRLGAPLPDGQTLVDLQAGHFAMTESPHPLLRDPESYRRGGDQAKEAARKVVAWVASQRPPGTTVAVERVRLLASRDPSHAASSGGGAAR